jgi:hypothetical protein
MQNMLSGILHEHEVPMSQSRGRYTNSGTCHIITFKSMTDHIYGSGPILY